MSASPDGTHIVTASDDGTARLWDATNGTEIKVLRGHDEYFVNSAVFSPDSTRILTASYDFTARLWDAKTTATRPSISTRSLPRSPRASRPRMRKAAGVILAAGANALSA